MDILKQSFYKRPAEDVARDLLGSYLVVRRESRVEKYRITETEAYVGPEDKASHAHRGKTPRNEPMFGEAGHWYVYLTYGIHWMLNVVTGEVGYPSAVLIRGVEGRDGPGKLTKKLGIDKRFNTKSVSSETGLWIERGEKVKLKDIEATARIGIKYAEEWVEKPLRFVLKRN